MQYPNITPAVFCSRENRFVATVELKGQPIKVHVKNTGRCRELLVPGATVYLTRSDNEKRKYVYDLVAVRKGELLVNMDSQAANTVFGEFLRGGGLLDGVTLVKPEYTFGASRIDFYFERGSERHLVEVKGVTLEENGVCRFPDAPTLRGAKHLRELAKAAGEGIHAWICFVVQMDGMKYLAPNIRTDPDFAAALREAAQAGVQVKAFCCRVEPDILSIDHEIPVKI